MKIRSIFTFIVLSLIFQSCCFGSKENYLGNNIYLSEYDNVDRRILFKEKRCATSGVEIVPMTVMGIAYNSEWIIAKSGNKRNKTNIRYWIIKNKYNAKPNSETVKKNTTEFDNYYLFKSYLAENKITLELKVIN